METYEVFPAGDTALVVDFGNRVDQATSGKVLALADRLNALGLSGIIETVPTIRSLSIYYEPFGISPADLRKRIADILEGLQDAEVAGRLCTIPICYNAEFAPDLAEVAARCGLSPARLIEAHSSRTYHVYMLGFLPGLAYLGDLPENLVLPRRETPRPRIPGGSLGIAGKLTCVYPNATPCGWHLIGRSPVSLWTPDAMSRTLLRAGDKVRFAPVSPREYDRILADPTIFAAPSPSMH